MKRLLLLVMVILVTLQAAAPAAALSCIEPRTAATNIDVVVTATVVERPSRQEMRLQVSRYHKGDGPEFIWVRLEGIDGGTEWLERNPPVGTEAVIGLRRSGGRFANQPCDPFVPLDSEQAVLILDDLGQGQPPSGDAEPGPVPAGDPEPQPIPSGDAEPGPVPAIHPLTSSTVVAALVLAVGAAVWFQHRRGRRAS